MCFKAKKEDDVIKVTSLTCKKMFKLIVNLSKENEKIEISIVDFKGYIDLLKIVIKFFEKK